MTPHADPLAPPVPFDRTAPSPAFATNPHVRETIEGGTRRIEVRDTSGIVLSITIEQR